MKAVTGLWYTEEKKELAEREAQLKFKLTQNLDDRENYLIVYRTVI